MPRRIDLDQRREQLAEAVWSTIRRSGVGAVSVRTVAAEAGVAVGSLRHVFPTRAELLRFSAELMVRRATERVRATAPSGDASVDALALLRHLLPTQPDSRTELEVQLALIAEAPAVPALTAIRDQSVHQVRVLARHVVDSLAPELAPPRAEAEALRLAALTDGLALQLLAQPADAPVEWALDVLRDEIARLSALA
ncbi:TetR/AcrR family transcriptional regulator [Microbacterium sp. Marseille-Q6965]|uniref:TetR/AcrR family transcriptional regulator n=1 Tax=Microbacterium sp. Marseille-Q6965 TaxID=2965072 RepID=UPI0021B7D124|nr:TetR/AcrR family transcriptional regulator [Microbacterium sp. Marseille-Q6965]